MVKEKKGLYLLFARGAYSVAQMRQNLIGILNGDIRLFFFFSTIFSSSRAGVAVLFNNNFQF